MTLQQAAQVVTAINEWMKDCAIEGFELRIASNDAGNEQFPVSCIELYGNGKLLDIYLRSQSVVSIQKMIQYYLFNGISDHWEGYVNTNLV